MPQGTTFEEFAKVTLETVKEPDYFTEAQGQYTFAKFTKLASGLSILFQVKMEKTSGKIAHAYPIAGEGINPLPATFRPGIAGVRKETSRVLRTLPAS